MKRKILIITISYIIGVIWGLYFNKNIALIFGIILGIIFIIKRKKYMGMILSVILLSCIYSSNVQYKYDTQYSNIEDITVIGTIVNEVSSENYLKKYVVNVTSVNGKQNFKNTKIIIYETINKGSKSITKYGNLIYVKGTFEYAEKNRNYKGYNYNEYLRSKKIYGIVKTDSNNVKILKDNNLNAYNNILYKISNCIKQKINNILPENTSSICTALILGDKSDVDENVINNFSESSLSHILAISGMHMYYIVFVISIVLSRVGKRKSNYIIIFIILLFCNLVGNTSSIVRASVMVILHLIGGILYRRSDSLTNLSVSALIILIFNPYRIKNIGFLLSFFATLGLIIFCKPLENKFQSILTKNKIIKYIKESIIVSISANVLIIPVLIIYFNKISIIFIISNLLANILLSIIMPLAIFSISISFFSIKLSIYLGYLLNFFLNILLYISQIGTKIKGSSIFICTPSILTILFYYLLVFVILMKKNTRKKYVVNKIIKSMLCIYTSISIIFYVIDIANTNMYIHFIDVGQGDSTVIITPRNKSILVDGGGSETSDYVGKNVLLPYLLNRGIKKIDYVIISHFDTDHVRRHIIFNAKNKNKKCNNCQAT